MSEQLCLQWNDFQDNIKVAFANLREDKRFTDVTLACEDGQQLEAHKVILGASSPFFQKLFEKNTHPHPLIYMRGLKSKDLSDIVNFLYCGEANVHQDHLESFLAMADELKLKGLTGEREDKKNERSSFVSGNDFAKEPYYQNDQKWKTSEQSHIEQIKRKPERTVSLVSSSISADLSELDEQIKSMIDSSENFITRKNGTQRKAFICKVCGTELGFSDMTRHVEANHITGVTHSCEICGQISRSRNALRQHTYSVHRS